MAAAQPEPTFLFVNPKSGGKKGEVFLKVPQPFEVPLLDGRTASLQIFSLLEGPSGNKPGFHLLRQACASRPVRTIVGGGDGTIMWVVGEATKHGIDVERQLHLGVVPLGTGNDFSRAAGWGGRNPRKLLEDDCSRLKTMVQGWWTGVPQPHDVWSVEVQVDCSEGGIFRVGEDQTEIPMDARTFTKSMINYCAFGQDSKVGMEFDKRRTKSQVGNMFTYAFSGCVTELDCWSAQRIGDLVHCLRHGLGPEGRAVFDNESEEAPELHGNPEMLQIVNISSYAAGLCHLWQEDTESALDPPHETVHDESNPGDGKLEVVAVDNLAELVTDSVFHCARRVFSGAPLFFEFESDSEADTVVYFHVDGEFFKLLNPEFMRITRSKTLQVLHNEDVKADDMQRFRVSLQNGAP